MKSLLFKKNRFIYVVNSLVVVSGGVERRNLDQILYLRSKGLQVDICVLRHIGPMADIYREHGIPVHYFRVYETFKNRRVKFFPLNFLRFYFFLFKEKYYTIIGTQPPSHYLVRFAYLPTLGRKVFTMERGNTYLRKKKYFLWDKICSLWTRKIICISEATRDGLLETSHISPTKLIVVEEGYKKEDCEDPPETLQARLKDKFVFGCVGGFIPTKRHDVFIRAFAKVNQVYPETRAVIIGEGVLSEELHSLAQSLGMGERIIFTGAVMNTHCYYPLFNAFVFPSIQEGLGGVFVEAWLHELSVICTDVRPMKDYIHHMENGILFKPDDVNDLANWMEYLIKHRPEAKIIGAKGHQTANERFDFEKQLGKLYTVLLNEKE